MPSPPLPLVQSLSPRIAVLTSEDVVQSCEANGCRGLEELLRPWEGGTERGELSQPTWIMSERCSINLIVHSHTYYTPNIPPSFRELCIGLPGPKRIFAKSRYDRGLDQ